MQHLLASTLSRVPRSGAGLFGVPWEPIGPYLTAKIPSPRLAILNRKKGKRERKMTPKASPKASFFSCYEW